jgi:phage terminase large subunit-like protein
LQGDHKDNVQPTKPERGKSSKRIDGISATVTALARAMANPPKSQSVYETRGVLYL